MTTKIARTASEKLCVCAIISRFKAITLAKRVVTILESNWNHRFWDEKTKLSICHHMLPSFIQLQNRSTFNPGSHFKQYQTALRRPDYRKATDSRWKRWILGSASDSLGSMSRSLPLDWSVFFLPYSEPSWVFWCGATVTLFVRLEGTQFLRICPLLALPPWRSPPQHLWHLIKLRTALPTFSLRP